MEEQAKKKVVRYTTENAKMSVVKDKAVIRYALTLNKKDTKTYLKISELLSNPLYDNIDDLIDLMVTFDYHWVDNVLVFSNHDSLGNMLDATKNIIANYTDFFTKQKEREYWSLNDVVDSINLFNRVLIYQQSLNYGIKFEYDFLRDTLFNALTKTRFHEHFRAGKPLSHDLLSRVTDDIRFWLEKEVNKTEPIGALAYDLYMDTLGILDHWDRVIEDFQDEYLGITQRKSTEQ